MVLPPSEVRWQDNPALAAASTALWRPGQPLILAQLPPTRVRPHTETDILTWNAPPISAAEMVCLPKSQLPTSEYARDTLPPNAVQQLPIEEWAAEKCCLSARCPESSPTCRTAAGCPAQCPPPTSAARAHPNQSPTSTRSPPTRLPRLRGMGGADRETLPALPPTPPVRQYGASPAAYPGRGGRSRATGIRESNRVTLLTLPAGLRPRSCWPSRRR